MSEFLNSEALKAYNNMNKNDKESATNMLNGLRFLAYKEKFLAGSWCYLTYFGRDSLISLRMIAPIVNAVVLESGITGMSQHLSAAGEISHEEDLGDQAFID